MRTKGAKNKPKIENQDSAPVIEVKKVNDEILSVPQENIKDENKQEIKIIEKIKEVPKIIYKTKPEKKIKETPALQLEQIQDPIKIKGLPKKWVAIGLIVVLGIVIYWKKDYLTTKFIEWRANRAIGSALDEGIEDISIN